MSNCIFLDRDGVINEDNGYVYRWEDFKFLPGVIESLKQISFFRIPIVIVTNQSGIARGYYTEKDLINLNTKIFDFFKKQNVEILDIFYCPHHSSGCVEQYSIHCKCRKPKPGMMISASKKHDINLHSSIMIGDKESDIESGINAGTKNQFLISKNTSIEQTNATKVYDSLKSCIDSIDLKSFLDV
jgi:D-glycero-D-manno-heptose 1,7-bisphosphate phosphatase